MSDTAIFGDIELYGDLYDPTVTLIPVGETEGYFTGLHPDEAALVAEWLPSEHFVPMHYPPGSEKPAAFERYCAERGVDETATILGIDAGETVELQSEVGSSGRWRRAAASSGPVPRTARPPAVASGRRGVRGLLVSRVLEFDAALGLTVPFSPDGAAGANRYVRDRGLDGRSTAY